MKLADDPVVVVHQRRSRRGRLGGAPLVSIGLRCAAVLDVVAVDRGDDDVVEAEFLHRIGHPPRLEDVERTLEKQPRLVVLVRQRQEPPKVGYLRYLGNGHLHLINGVKIGRDRIRVNGFLQPDATGIV